MENLKGERKRKREKEKGRDTQILMQNEVENKTKFWYERDKK